MLDGFDACDICGTNDWRLAFDGAIRNGTFGHSLDKARVGTCGECGVERLEESLCPDETFYETDAYRQTLKHGLSSGEYFAVADNLQRYAFDSIPISTVRNKVVAEIGAAGGSYLDQICGATASNIAVEPCSIYHDSLISRGYNVFSYSADAHEKFVGKVDVAVSLQVIEHVRNPRSFLSDILPLLSADGTLLISTPNRHDILMNLLPDLFPSFFYRAAHRWYFTAETLAECAHLAGFSVERTQFVHRYGMSNTLAWLRDNKPTGHVRLPGIDQLTDGFWKNYLEDTGRSDCIHMLLKPRRSS